MRAVIDGTLADHAPVGAPPTWVLSNHDVGPARHALRPRGHLVLDGQGDSANSRIVVLGTRRARAAALLTMALPGGVYVYQGDELGLAEVLDIPPDRIQDPTWERSGHTDRGRDGCRVPLPWSGDVSPFGFSGPGAQAHAEPWLPQPASWKDITAATQSQDPESMLNLYREALTLRRETISGLPTDVTWLDAGADVVAFSRSEDFTCVVNFSDTPVDLPAARRVLLSSDVVTGGKLAPNAAVWLGGQA